MFTARAVGFLVLAVFLFLLGGVTNVGWVRIVDAVIWGMLGLSLLLQWLSVKAVDARRRVVKIEHSAGSLSPMEDDIATVELELENGWFWPRFFLSAAYEAPSESPESRWHRFFVANLSGHGRVRLESGVRCYRRGLHRFDPVTIESRAPFGLFRRRRRVEAPLSLLVYPRAYPLRRLALTEGALGPSERQQRARTGPEVVGSRQYYPGDSLRNIHWRNTARTRRLAVREMEDAVERALTVVFDVRRSIGDGRETTMEYSIKLAATIGMHVLKSGESIRLVAGNVRGEWADPEPFLRELALIESSASPPMDTALQTLSGHSPVIAIVAGTDHEAARAVERSMPRLPGLAAVVLEGFSEPDAVPGPAQSLQRAGLPTVVCQRGKLAEAVSELEALAAAPEQRAGKADY